MKNISIIIASVAFAFSANIWAGDDLQSDNQQKITNFKDNSYAQRHTFKRKVAPATKKPTAPAAQMRTTKKPPKAANF